MQLKKLRRFHLGPKQILCYQMDLKMTCFICEFCCVVSVTWWCRLWMHVIRCYFTVEIWRHMWVKWTPLNSVYYSSTKQTISLIHRGKCNTHLVYYTTQHLHQSNNNKTTYVWPKTTYNMYVYTFEINSLFRP